MSEAMKRGRPPKSATHDAAPAAKKARPKSGSDAVVGFEEKLWQMADKLRNNMDAAEYKHVVRLIENTIVDSHVTIVRAASNVDPWFLGGSIIEREPEIEALGEGSTGQTELSRVRLGGLLGVRPSEELQQRFGNAVSYQLRRIAANEREAKTLAGLRDDVLPRLLSGELPVDAAEREAEGMA